MQSAPNSLLAQIGKALRANYDAVAKEPLPERWAELIQQVGERERAEDSEPDRKETHKQPSPR